MSVGELPPFMYGKPVRVTTRGDPYLLRRFGASPIGAPSAPVSHVRHDRRAVVHLTAQLPSAQTPATPLPARHASEQVAPHARHSAESQAPTGASHEAASPPHCLSAPDTLANVFARRPRSGRHRLRLPRAESRAQGHRVERAAPWSWAPTDRSSVAARGDRTA